MMVVIMIALVFYFLIASFKYSLRKYNESIFLFIDSYIPFEELLI